MEGTCMKIDRVVSDNRAGCEGNGKTEGKISIATWNIGTMTNRTMEVTETLSKWKVDVCCVQETRWKGAGARIFSTGTDSTEDGSYKFYWHGGENGKAGVGILVKMNWAEKVVEVKRVNDRLIALKMVWGKKVLNIVAAYAPQMGRSAEEKDKFWWELMELVAGMGKGEEVVIGGDMNGHVGESAEGYEEAHGGHGYGTRNEEGERIF
jgi:exonuclease III